MWQRLVRWWLVLTQCRHDKLVGKLLDDESALFDALLAIQGWPAKQINKGCYIRTWLGSHTFTFPILYARRLDVAAILALGVINQTPIYGVMGFQIGKDLMGYRDFPLDARLRLQMCPSYQDVIFLFETEIIPHFKKITDGKQA